MCADDAHDAYQRGLEILMRHAARLDPERAAGWLHTVVYRHLGTLALPARAARQSVGRPQSYCARLGGLLGVLAPNYSAWQEATVGPLNGAPGSTSSTVSHVGPPGGDGLLRLFDEQGDRVVAPTDACSSSRLSHKPVRRPVRQSVVGQQCSTRRRWAGLVGRGHRSGPIPACPSHRCGRNLSGGICATASVPERASNVELSDARLPGRERRSAPWSARDDGPSARVAWKAVTRL